MALETRTDPASRVGPLIDEQALDKVTRHVADALDRGAGLLLDGERHKLGAFYSCDVGRIFRVSERLEYGIHGIHTGFISVEVAPFGGAKESGIGREGSKYGVDDWTETRYLALGGIER